MTMSRRKRGFAVGVPAKGLAGVSLEGGATGTSRPRWESLAGTHRECGGLIVPGVDLPGHHQDRSERTRTRRNFRC